MYRTKIISLAIILILFSSVAQAQESEGLIQRAYRKFVVKDKIVEKKHASKPEDTGTVREVAGEGTKTVVYDDFHKNMSKVKMIEEIKDEVDSEEELLEQIPELKRQKGRDGKDIYSYLVEGKQVNLEDVDEKILRSLVEQVSMKAEKFRTAAILGQQEQLSVMRNTNAISRPPQAPSRSQAIPQRPPIPPRK